MAWEDWEQAAERGPMSLLWRFVGAFIVLTLILWPVGVVVRSCTNATNQAERIIEKTIDADNVIYNYEWFKQRNQDVLSIDAKVVDAQGVLEQFSKDCGPRDKWHFDDRIEYARLASIRQGLAQQRNDLAAEYNARSKMANRSIFKTGELPDSITIK